MRSQVCRLLNLGGMQKNFRKSRNISLQDRQQTVLDIASCFAWR